MSPPAEHAEHVVAAGDEGRHPAGEEELWNESVYVDFASSDGTLGGYARIGLYPNLGVTWWHAVLCGPGRPTTVVATCDAPLPGAGFGPAYEVGVPLASARLAFDGPAVSHDDPVDVYRGAPGRPATLAMELTFSTDGSPFAYAGVTRYEVPVTVRGWVEVDGERIAVDCAGQRDHSWGVRDWWAFGWCWAAARLSDGTRVHVTQVRLPGMEIPFGYVQAGDAVAPVAELVVTEALGAEGLPASAAITVDGLELAVTPLAFGPLLLTAPDGRTSRFPRALARWDAADGRTGTGWVEWNQVQPAP